MISLSSSTFKFALCLGFVFGHFEGVGGVDASLVGQDVKSVVYNR